MLFKICGLKEINIIDCCEKKNVDFFGMIFYDKSPRYITLKQAQELIDFSKNKNIKPVGVFVNENFEIVIWQKNVFFLEKIMVYFAF